MFCLKTSFKSYQLSFFIVFFAVLLTTASASYKGSVCAFFDVNFDRYTDILARLSDRFSFLLASTQSDSFEENSAYKIHFPDGAEIKDVVNCAVGDFDADAYPDILFTLEKEEGEFNIFICFGSKAGKFDCNATKGWRAPEITGQPTVGDFNGDGVTDFFLPQKPKNLCVFGVQRLGNVSRSLNSKTCFENSTAEQDLAHAFVDFDGDLNADFVIGAASGKKLRLDYWSRSGPDAQWSLVQSEELSADQKQLFPTEKRIKGQPIVGDFDANGIIDLILPICADEVCSKPELKLQVHSQTVVKTEISLNLIESERASWKPVGSSHFHVGVGDFNLDGYPDLLLMLWPEGGTSGPFAFLVENTDCSSNCSLWSRSFRVVWEPRFALPVPKGAEITKVFFFDLQEDGNLDILVEFHEDGTDKFDFVESSDKGDTSFLKIQAYTGTCCRECGGVGREGSGIPAPGATLLYRSVDEKGRRIVGAHGQLSQSSNGVLQVPFALFGLGRTPNFVEHLAVGVPSWGPLKNRSWEQIIPNSRLYVIPWEKPSQWISRLYLTPSRLILLSFAALCLVCGIILLLVVIFYWRERREDKLEKQQQAHKFHFDAM